VRAPPGGRVAISLTTNMTSMRNAKNFSRANSIRDKLVSRLSSGNALESSAADVVRYGAAERLDADVRTLLQAKRNVENARSAFQTFEGSFNEVIQLQKRMRELAVQGASDTVDPDARAMLSQDYLAMAEQADQILQQTIAPMFEEYGWNAGGGKMRVVVDTGTDESSAVEFDLGSVPFQVVAPGGDGLDTAAHALNALSDLGFYLEDLTRVSTTFGSWQERLEHIASVIDQKVERLSANRSQFMDADFALESAEMARNDLVRASALSVLAQSNRISGDAVRLLG